MAEAVQPCHGDDTVFHEEQTDGNLAVISDDGDMDITTINREESAEADITTGSNVAEPDNVDSKENQTDLELLSIPNFPDNWLHTEKKFTRACDQIMLLSQNLKELEYRFQMAIVKSQPHIYSALESRIQVLEGVRNAYYCYVDLKMEQLMEIERVMTEELLLQ